MLCYATNNNNSGGQIQAGTKAKKYCGYCKKANHTINDCYARQAARPPYNNNNNFRGKSGNYAGQPPQTVRMVNDGDIDEPDVEYPEESGEEEGSQ